MNINAVGNQGQASQGNQERHFISLPTIPDLGTEYAKIVADTLPGIGTKRVADKDPSTGYAVDAVTIDPHHLAAYNQVVGLRTSSHVPVTYPFVLSFPLMMRVMRAPDFPFSPMGAVHISNEITQTHALSITDEFTVEVHARNVREHRKGLLVDMVTDIIVGKAGDAGTSKETVWTQTSTFLGIGARLADADVDTAAPELQEIKARGCQRGTRLPAAGEPPEFANTAVWKVSAADIKQYAAVSGDKNPVHVSALGAKAFGFPNVIAHGMWTAATMLTPLEGRVDGAMRYTVDFASPIVLPARIAYWTRRSPTVPTRGVVEDSARDSDVPTREVVEDSARDSDVPTRELADAPTWDMQVRKAGNPERVHAVARLTQL